MQQDIPEHEAREVLGAALICDDPGDWVADKSHAFTDRIQCGLVNLLGERRGLLLDFKYAGHRKNNPERFILTVFKVDRGRNIRVYQLDIQRWPYLPKSQHSWPHEHIGDTRITGDASWLTWTFDDILNRFCETTNIEFRPEAPANPAVFTLKKS